MPEQYRHREIHFNSSGATLAGTYTTPEITQPVPSVLFLPGSGQTDRDDNAKALAIKLFPALADAVTEHGFATLRYDKRGVGASEGDYFSSGFNDRLTDAVAAIDWLLAQGELDPAKVFAVGHSEGALIATRLAAGAAGRDSIAGAVLLGGSVLAGEQTMRWQGRQVAGGLTGFNAWLVRVLRIDPVRSQQKSLDRLKATTGDVARISLKKYNAKWFREFLAYDPAPDFARIRVPVLAITGEKDIQVDPADLERMRELVHGDIETHRLSGVTHLMRTEGAKPGLSGYKEQVRRPVDPRLIELVTNWLEKESHHGNAH